MLRLTIPAREVFDDETQEFSSTKETTLSLEHSLVSISKWEARWHLPYLHTDMTMEQMVDYIQCMTITQNVPPDVYRGLTQDNVDTVLEYIQDSMTATTVTHRQQKFSRDIVTSELIYYWMIALQIPPQYEKWHLNRLLTLIDVCNVKNGPADKMSKKEINEQYRAINAQRRAELAAKKRG